MLLKANSMSSISLTKELMPSVNLRRTEKAALVSLNPNRPPRLAKGTIGRLSFKPYCSKLKVFSTLG